MNAVNSTVVFTHGPTQWIEPVQLSAANLLKLSSTAKTLQSLLTTLKQLTLDEYLEFMLAYYQRGQSLFGEDWGYNDLLAVLQAATTVLKPENYLEIGVRRGRSLSVVAAGHPSTNIFGFDLWIQDYAGMKNPGPQFVAEELKKLNHTGKLDLISGDSRKTIPQFFMDNPNLYFDLITVDGDHSLKGARIDLKNVIPRLKVGGVLLLDDIKHPQHRYLELLWDKLISKNPHFSSAKYNDLGYGVACAVRQSF